MLALVLALSVLSNLVHQVEGILIKKYNAKYDKGGSVFVAIVSLFSMLFFLITDKGGFDFRLSMLPYGIISGICYCTASLATFVALGAGPFGISRLLLSYTGIFSISYGLFFRHEKPSTFALIGIGLMLVSIYFNRKPNNENDKKASLKWAICIILTIICSGMFGVLQKLQQDVFNNEVNNEFMIVSLGFSAITLFIAGFIKDGKDSFRILKNGAPYASCSGISNGLTNFINIIVNGMAINFSILSPIRTGLGMIITFIISIFIFKEKLLKRQIFGVALGTIALILLSF